MEAAIEKRCNSTDKSSVKELVLDACKIPQFTEQDAAHLQAFTSLESLYLNRVGLRSLENLPVLRTLKNLEIMDNALAEESHLDVLAKFANLEDLSLCGNKIQNLACLEPLLQLPKLKSLDIELNPVCENLSKEHGPSGTTDTRGMIYREIVFKMFPDLKVVDKMDRAGNELEEADTDEEDEDDDDYEDDDEEDLAEFYNKEYAQEDDAEEAAEENAYVPEGSLEGDSVEENESSGDEKLSRDASKRGAPPTDESVTKKAKTDEV